MSANRILFAAALLLGSATSLPVAAASFDCAAANTPFEHAICDVGELSAADERLAKSFATATGGLTKESVVLMRGDQRAWLDYAQRACTDDAEPLTRGSYPEAGGSCLVEKFNARSSALEQSRMIDGHRFFIKTFYAALPDPNEVDNPDSYWKVASYEAVLPQLDADDAWAKGFNRFVLDEAARNTETISMIGAGNIADLDASSDNSLNIEVKELGGTSRITLEVGTYWYGHGAAHGNWSISYLHYLTKEERGLRAEDVFAGDDWQVVLRDAAWAQLQTEHSEWLQVESPDDIAELVVNPSRWDLSNDYGLVIQFQPYEVSAYAYGAPTVTIPWEKLDAIKAETQDQVRWGY
ncbi:DUF3298 domain-containing protein [Devosia oryziradicis]|uniref:DUF3298 domain-containing protein n=1 Tax=Devosia oryziradicis TaxID=2801335 RepID=A0ABX7BZL0_9HYPH|nr:DUF3298 domain-containing protein [Devosia oryziradicis]QQR36973.1 DUF3298 domain-containing protein [Devosia oryziradicis]